MLWKSILALASPGASIICTVATDLCKVGSMETPDG